LFYGYERSLLQRVDRKQKQAAKGGWNFCFAALSVQGSAAANPSVMLAGEQTEIKKDAKVGWYFRFVTLSSWDHKQARNSCKQDNYSRLFLIVNSISLIMLALK
jgi:hypothetical protein